jgi:hypothetical protein
MLPGGVVVAGNDPVRVGFQIDPSRYAALDDAQRDDLHHRCTPIARDVALLFCGRSGPLSIALAPPDPPDPTDQTGHGVPRQPLATFEVP